MRSRELLMVRSPIVVGAAPGERKAPPAMLVAPPIVPLPPRVPPLLTVTVLPLAVEPFTSNVPALTVVPPM